MWGEEPVSWAVSVLHPGGLAGVVVMRLQGRAGLGPLSPEAPGGEWAEISPGS